MNAAFIHSSISSLPYRYIGRDVYVPLPPFSIIPLTKTQVDFLLILPQHTADTGLLRCCGVSKIPSPEGGKNECLRIFIIFNPDPRRFTLVLLDSALR